MKINHFTYRVNWSAEDNEHVGLCAEFPSLSWLAATPEKALSGIRRVVDEVITEMKACVASPSQQRSLKSCILPCLRGTANSMITD
jgi:hypothetical protein